MSAILKIHGTVTRGGKPVEAAYVDLLDGEGLFVAERRTGPEGTYEFHTTPGSWRLNCRAADSDTVEREVSGEEGELQVDIELSAP